MFSIIRKIKFYISPYFIANYYLARDIGEICTKYKFTGKIIDVGCGGKPYKYLFKEADNYKGIDFKNYSFNKDFSMEEPDLYFDKNYEKNFNLPFKNESFQNSVSFQVIEHHKVPEKFIKELSRITKKNGFILLTAPFMWGIHEEPNDYQRFTRYKFVNLLKNNNLKVLEIKEQGSLFSTISMLLNQTFCDFLNKNKFTYLFGILIYAPFLLFQYLSLFIDMILSSKRIFFSYLVLTRKVS